LEVGSSVRDKGNEDAVKENTINLWLTSEEMPLRWMGLFEGSTEACTHLSGFHKALEVAVLRMRS